MSVSKIKENNKNREREREREREKEREREREDTKILAIKRASLAWVKALLCHGISVLSMQDSRCSSSCAVNIRLSAVMMTEYYEGFVRAPSIYIIMKQIILVL